MTQENKRKIYFITSNREKVMMMKNALSKFKKEYKGKLTFEIIPKKMHCPEIQSDDIEKVSKESAIYACKKLKADVIKIDSGFLIDALNGFPGTYTAYVERKLSAEKILKLMKYEKNRGACYQYSLTYCKKNGETFLFTDFTLGKIAEKSKGKYGWGYDKIFISEFDKTTMANYPDKERIKKYSNSNLMKLFHFLMDFD